MANSNTYIRDGFVSAGSAQITGSLGVTGGITGSLQGTASYATQALSASYAPSAGGATFPFTGSAIVSGSLTVTGSLTATGLVGIGVTTPTAVLHLKAGTAAASTAPLKLTSGTNLTTPEAGAIEFDGNSLFFTTGSTRSTLLTSINPTSSTNINVQGLTIGKGRTGSLDNVYIHTASVSPNVTGTRNVGIGGATTGVTSGNYNIGVGYAAGVSATTATHNAFFGGFAGYLSNGSYNTFVGMEANYKAAGSSNVAVGFDCMFENTGTRNTGVGPQAGMLVATGNDNTYFGYNAGRYIADGVTNSGISSASVFLGVDSRPLASSQTNQIVIGHQAIGLGSNTVVIGNNSITTTALKGNTQVSGSLNVSGSTTIRGTTTTTGNVSVTGNLSSTAKYILGSDLSLTPIAGNQSVLTSWWGLQIVGNKQSTVDYTPSAIGNNSDFSVIIPNQQAAKIGLIVRGQTSQTGNLLELRNVSNTGLAAFDSTGQLALGKTTPTAVLDVNGNTRVTGSLLLSGSSLVAGYNSTPLAGTIQDGVTSILGNLNDWNSDYYQGTVLYSETAASTITFGQLCYRTQNETWDLADATAANSAAAFNMLGICVKSSTATNPTSILINGFVETATYAAILKSGEPLYMATTPGSMTKTAPTTSGNAVRLIGNTFWDSNTNTKIIIRFNPENSWIELT